MLKNGWIVDGDFFDDRVAADRAYRKGGIDAGVMPIRWMSADIHYPTGRHTFLICPVRGVDQTETQAIVDRLERDGWHVHWPPRDTDQNDPVGLRICRDNAAAIAAADVVHVVWDGRSQGCLFDLGVAFALGKKVVPVSLPSATESKSFQNMVTAWARSA